MAGALGELPRVHRGNAQSRVEAGNGAAMGWWPALPGRDAARGCWGLNLHAGACKPDNREPDSTTYDQRQPRRSMAVGHSATDDKCRAGVVSSWAGVWPAPLPPPPAGARRTQPAITGRSVAHSKPRPVLRWG